MNIKRILIPLLLIIVMASMVAFGSSVPIGPNYNDSVMEYGNDGLTIKSSGITHLLIAPDAISGMTDVTSADADYILIWDATDSALKKCDMGEVRSAGYTNLTSFVDQTAWRVFYSNTAGDVVELALGADGTYLKSNGAAAAPTFAAPAGGGETNTTSNIGSQVEIYKQKTGVDFELRTLKANSNQISISTVPVGGDIDIGAAATNRSAQSNIGYTNINEANTANQTGTITSIEIWANVDITGVIVATFEKVGANDFTARDSEAIANITAGSKVTRAVSLSVTAGDYIGVYYAAGRIELSTSGGAGLWHKEGDYTSCASETFPHDGAFEISLYGTGETSPLDYIKFDIEEGNIKLDDLGTPDDNTDNDSSTSKHGLMPKLPFSGDLLSTTTVAFNADADTTLYTVPAGKRCVLSHAIVVAAGDAGATTTISIGQNTAETDFIPANTLSNLDAQYDSVILQPIPNTTPLKTKSYAAATVIEARVASQSGVAANTVYLFGMTY